MHHNPENSNMYSIAALIKYIAYNLYRHPSLLQVLLNSSMLATKSHKLMIRSTNQLLKMNMHTVLIMQCAVVGHLMTSKWVRFYS